MLTRELAVVDYRDGVAYPDRLFAHRHGRYLSLAERMLAVYRNGLNAERRALHREVRQLFQDEPDCPPRRIDAFCKLLDEAARFEGESPRKAAKLRIEIFSRAASLHPLVSNADKWFEHDEQSAKKLIATERKTEWPAIEERLFADVIEFHRLKAFSDDWDAKALLARYNVAQTQVALFDARRMTVIAAGDFKSILRYAKLARLMHTVQQLPGGEYRFDFDGPTSVLGRTHRYGATMARFLPGLLSCRGWKLQALLQPRQQRGLTTLTLTSESGLSSPVFIGEAFDSTVESDFAEQWGQAPREGWTIERETQVLQRGQQIFVPDFVFRHQDGRSVMLEIIGYWTPEYLAHKRQVLKAFADHPFILAVEESTKSHLGDQSQPCIGYKKKLNVQDVVAILDRLVG